MDFALNLESEIPGRKVRAKFYLALVVDIFFKLFKSHMD